MALDVRSWFGDGKSLRPRARVGQLELEPTLLERRDGLGRAVVGQALVPRAAEQEHRDLGGLTADHSRVVPAPKGPGAVGAVPPGAGPAQLDGHPGRADQGLAGVADLVPDLALIAIGELAWLPPGLRAADVLMVDEVLQTVEGRLQRRDPVHRQPGRSPADSFDE